jgi:hypothetical protein
VGRVLLHQGIREVLGSDALGPGGLGPDTVATVMLHSRSKVPPGYSMRGPSAAGARLLMDEHFNARGSHWRAVKVEVAVHLGVGRKVWMEATAAQKVQSLGCLWDEPVPQVHGKTRIGGAQSGHKMIFVGPDGSFGGVTAVYVGRRQLHVDVLVVHKLEQRS